MGNRILLADDSITIQKVVGIIFANEDCELTVVDNGDAALEKARENRPDVMLVDAVMPGKSGYDVCAAVRRDPLLRNVPILLLTGAFEPFDEEKASRCGADDFISKPFESQQLIEKVKGLLDLGRSRAARETEPSVSKAVPEPSPPGDVEPFVIEFDEPVPAESSSAPQPQPIVFELEEVSPEDDLWGAFELDEEVTGVDAVRFGGAVAGGPPSGAAEASSPSRSGETVDFPGFDLEPAPETRFGPPPGADEFLFTQEAEEVSPSISGEPLSFSSGEELFVFGDEGGEEIVEPYGTVSSEPVTEEKAYSFETLRMPREEEPVEAAAAFPLDSREEMGTPPPMSVAETTQGGTITLTEEQLAAAISRISREVIERIAWEVVPDLAETLIREEIRRIREGSQ